MDFSYALTPFLAWLVAGVSKFVINSIKAKQLAFGLIGYGGLPSNHSAIVSSMAALIALKEGVGHPAFGVAITLAFIVMLDANSLRRQVASMPWSSTSWRGGHLTIRPCASAWATLDWKLPPALPWVSRLQPR